MIREACPTSCEALRPGEKCWLQIKAETITSNVPPLNQQKAIPGLMNFTGITREGSRAHRKLTKLHNEAEKLGCPSIQRATKLNPDYPGKENL